MMSGWNKAGCIGRDAFTDTTAVSSLIGAGSLVAHSTGGKPGIRAQESTFGPPGGLHGAPQRALTNHELADLIVYGIEGLHYERKDGLPDTAGGGHNGACNTLAWLYPNQFMCTVTVGSPGNLWDLCREFNASSKKSAAMGFSFDATPVSTGIAACTNVYNEYQKELEFGFAADPDAKLAEMNERLKAAGIDAIIAGKQAQIDAWAATR